MSVPQPPSELEGHCSAIYDNTLYVLSPDSFLSLPLERKAQWSQRPMGVPVTGAACAQVGRGDATALYVIGGKSDQAGYGGMQRYNFAQRSWETLSPDVGVLSDRTEHSVAYLEDTQQILVYAGSQPDAYSYLSSQTFLVSTEPPNNILAFTSEAPPGNMPIVQPFNTSHAVMLGGSDFNIEIFTFGPSDGWRMFGTNITDPIDPSSRATIIDGADGSKVVQIYDMHVSPNSVTPVVLLAAGGQPAYTGQLAGSGPSSRKRKRELTLHNWPSYNNDNAPSATRSDCAVAQSPDGGMAVISGGSTESPVALFNQNKNRWVDAADFFDSKEQQPLQPTKSSDATKSTPSSTTTSSPSSTTTAAAGGGLSTHDRMLRTLAITLGVLCGIAAIFIIVLLFLRWRKLKKRKQEGYLDEKNERMSFADRGASFMKEAGGSINNLPPPGKAWNDSQNGSHSSLAIIAGKFNNRRNTSHEPKPSYDSTAPIFKDKMGTPMPHEQMEMMDLDEKRIDRKPVPRKEARPPSAPYGPTLTAADAMRISTDSERLRNRSSGWSKYFATSQPTGPNGISHLPSGYTQTNKMSDASIYSTDRNMSQPSQIPSSALVPPLDIDFSKTVDGQRLSHVTSGSPAFNDSREDLARGGTNFGAEAQKGYIVDPSRRSASDTISSYNRSTMSTTTSEYYNESGATPWTPTSTSFKDHLNSRAPSSVYPDRDSEPRLPSRGKGTGGGFFPGAGTSFRPSPKSKLATSSGPTSPIKPTAAASNTKVLIPPTRPAEDRDSTVTVFPKGVPSAYYAGREDQNLTPLQQKQQVGGAAGGMSAAAVGKPRDSNLTLFPKGVPSAYYAGRERENEGAAKPVNSDLGWLNLGLHGNGSGTRV